MLITFTCVCAGVTEWAEGGVAMTAAGGGQWRVWRIGRMVFGVQCACVCAWCAVCARALSVGCSSTMHAMYGFRCAMGVLGAVSATQSTLNNHTTIPESNPTPAPAYMQFTSVSRLHNPGS